MIDNDKCIITKSNSLIHASYSFSLNEYRIILYGISLINPIDSLFPETFIVDIRRFAEIFQIDVNGLYNDLKKTIANKFFSRRFTVVLDDGKKKLCHWLENLTYEDGIGYLELKFSESSVPLLVNLKSKYTNFYINQITNFKSIYSIRIYEFCIMEINKSKYDFFDYEVTIKEIKKRLDILDKYKRYSHLKIKILNHAKAEINEHSDLTIDFEEIKRGRTVESIKFIVQRKEGATPARYQKIEQSIPEESIQPQSKPVLPTAEEMAAEMVKDSIKERLMDFGIIEKVADKLVNEHSLGFIEKHIDYTINKMKQGSVTNSAAFLVDSINHGYAT